MIALRDFLICVPATVFFCILFKVPKKAILISSLLGGAGYVVYDLTSPVFGSTIAGYFLGTLFMAIFSEILARTMKMPATIFMIPSIIPLVPGVGLYKTMEYLVQAQNARAAQTGTSTILAIVAMAMAMVLTGIITKTIQQVISSIIKYRQAKAR